MNKTTITMASKETIITGAIRKRISKVWLRDDDILEIDIEPNELFEYDDMQELIDAAEEIGSGKRFLNLIKVGKFTTPDHAAREYSTSEAGSKYKIADAFVINTIPQKIIANFYMRFHKPCVPTRFFSKESEAIKWLKSFQIDRQFVVN